MEFKNYLPPTFDVICMKQVYLTSERSKDVRTKIGAVLVKEKNIIGTGYNGFARKVLDLPERYNDKETKYKFVVHAEDNAILTCARLGISTMNSILYTQAFPCNDCMKSVIQAGIKKIIIHKQWPNMNPKWLKLMEISKIMMKESEIQLEILDKKLNMVGYLDGNIINI